MPAEKIAYYLFEYDQPPSAKTGRARPPGRTRWRMTLEEAATRHPGYRPIMATVEYRDAGNSVHREFPGYEPGTGPAHWGKGNLDGQGNPIDKATSV